MASPPWTFSSADFRIAYLRLLIWDLGHRVKARAILRSPKSRKLTVQFLVKLVQLKIIGKCYLSLLHMQEVQSQTQVSSLVLGRVILETAGRKEA